MRIVISFLFLVSLAGEFFYLPQLHKISYDLVGKKFFLDYSVCFTRLFGFQKVRAKMSQKRNVELFFAIVAVSVITMFLPIQGLSLAGKRALGVFMFAALCWITEVIPIAATGGIVVGLLAFLLPPVLNGVSVRTFYAAFSAPVIVLFAGGYFIAAAVQKYRMDGIFTAWILRRTGTEPKMVLGGMMFAAAFLSMWMSNTATTALMIAVALPVVRKIKDDPFSVALLLGIPFAANVGGIATPIGTPPNAIAIEFLADAGKKISFGQWFMWGFPITLVMTVIIWYLLRIFFQPKVKEIKFETRDIKFTTNHKIVAITFAVTAILWFTEKLHGVSTSLVAMLPPAVFLITGVLTRQDIKTSVGWDILILVAGGIALGTGMKVSGLSEWILTTFHLKALSPVVVILLFGILSLALSSFMSHTAATNLLIPLAISVGTSVSQVVVMTALVSSCAMIFPVSTPPNAIAYGSGMIKSSDMNKAGVVIALIGFILNYVVVQLLVR